MEEHRLNALDFFRGTKWVRKFTSCTLVVEAMFHSRLEEMIRLGSDAFGFLVSLFKMDDNGNRKPRNALYL
jgi:hypothetical protein